MDSRSNLQILESKTIPMIYRLFYLSLDKK